MAILQEDPVAVGFGFLDQLEGDHPLSLTEGNTSQGLKDSHLFGEVVDLTGGVRALTQYEDNRCTDIRVLVDLLHDNAGNLEIELANLGLYIVGEAEQEFFRAENLDHHQTFKNIQFVERFREFLMVGVRTGRKLLPLIPVFAHVLHKFRELWENGGNMVGEFPVQLCDERRIRIRLQFGDACRCAA